MNAEHPTLKRFTYWNNSERANGEMLLSTVASSIAFADAELVKKKGFDPVRCPWIGCEVLAFESVPFTPPLNPPNRKRSLQAYETFRANKLASKRTVKTYEMFLEEQAAHARKMSALKPDEIPAAVSMPSKPKPKPERKMNPSPRDLLFVANETNYTIGQLEHIGDAIAEVAVRSIAHRIAGTNRRAYYGTLSSQLRTNENFATCPGIKTGDQFEIVIGQEFALYGIEPALAKAIEMIEQTKVYLEAL